MKTFKLEGTPRTEIGKKPTKALRKEGLIPAIFYGHELVELPYKGKLETGQSLIESQGKGMIVNNFFVSFADVRKLIYTPEIFLVELTLGKKVYNAILKDLQTHPVSDEILHLDFLNVFEDKPIVMEVPVILEGHAAGVKAGGKLSLVSRKLRVKAFAKDIPENLKVDVENLELGKSIQVKTLNFDKLQLVNAPDSVVCSVVMTRSARAAADAAASAEK